MCLCRKNSTIDVTKSEFPVIFEMETKSNAHYLDLLQNHLFSVDIVDENFDRSQYS